MVEVGTCPICLSQSGCPADLEPSGWDFLYKCPVCGDFYITHDARDDYSGSYSSRLSSVVRARLSHRLRVQHDQGRRGKITNEAIAAFIDDGFPGPSPAQQVTNIVRFVGGHVMITGRRLEVTPVQFYAVIGAVSEQFAIDLVEQLIDRKVLSGRVVTKPDGLREALDCGLTLAGWEQYEAEKRGLTAGNYGFLALKFNDPTLDPFVAGVVKPASKQLGYDLVDMRDVAQAGIIDNLMRMSIRDSAFLLADLTHANNGAYWEAGFAEGLGKPVIYLCRSDEWKERQTHFDTNHCTTVVWHENEPDAFSQNLVATLRNSLKLFVE